MVKDPPKASGMTGPAPTWAKTTPSFFAKKGLSTSISFLQCQMTKTFCDVLIFWCWYSTYVTWKNKHRDCKWKHVINCWLCLMSLLHCMYSASPLTPRHLGILLYFSLFKIVICYCKHVNMLTLFRIAGLKIKRQGYLVKEITKPGATCHSR